MVADFLRGEGVTVDGQFIEPADEGTDIDTRSGLMRPLPCVASPLDGENADSRKGCNRSVARRPGTHHVRQDCEQTKMKKTLLKK
jgi:hypothetical protein